jgi:hypothetical protein
LSVPHDFALQELWCSFAVNYLIFSSAQAAPPNIAASLFRMIAKRHWHSMQFFLLTDRCQPAVALALQIRDLFGGSLPIGSSFARLCYPFF